MLMAKNKERGSPRINADQAFPDFPAVVTFLPFCFS